MGGEGSPSLTNAYDGNWHKFSFYVNWNTGTILGWYDEENETVGNAIKSYTSSNNALATGSDADDLVIHGNFSDDLPTEETYHAIDDIEIWDGMPTASSTSNITGSSLSPGCTILNGN